MDGTGCRDGDGTGAGQGRDRTGDRDGTAPGTGTGQGTGTDHGLRTMVCGLIMGASATLRVFENLPKLVKTCFLV